VRVSLRVRSVLLLVTLGLVTVALAPPGSSVARQNATLSVSPGSFVGGQLMTFEGNIGLVGQRRVRLQTHMGRPGDSWTRLEGFSTLTDPDGSFRFTYPAPSMFGIKVRVATKGAATPAWVSNAKSQDLVLSTRTSYPALPDGQVRAGESFTIDVDTTPTLYRRPDLPAPAIPGRTLTLQQRVNGNRWSTLDTTTTNQKGQGSFTVRVNNPGTVVYRVRQEDWTVNGNEIGWFPSYPTYVNVRSQSARTGTETTVKPATGTPVQRTAASSAGALSELAEARLSGAPSTSSQAFGWAPSLWDFAWEFGESLTSPPYRGTDPKGWWSDASNGSGRVSKHNGGLMLNSQRGYDGPGDHGTTSVTLRGNPMKYGRWETKLRLKSPENNARDYRVKIQLVPDRQRDYHCGAQNITVADVAAHGRRVKVEVKARKGSRKWSYSKRIGSLNDNTAAFAVEVAKGHISWFVNGRVIATVRNRAAVSDVPMTLRLSLVGQGQKEMNATQVISDWQRGFSIKRGRTVTGGHSMRGGTFSGGC
jgi:hypothetical protein